MRLDVVDSRRSGSYMHPQTEVRHCRILTQLVALETLTGKGVTVNDGSTGKGVTVSDGSTGDPPAALTSGKRPGDVEQGANVVGAYLVGDVEGGSYNISPARRELTRDCHYLLMDLRCGL